MSRHVLVPIDGSDTAFDALRFAFEQHEGSRFTVLHVVSPTEGLVADGDASYVDQEMIDSALDRGEGLCETARDIATEYGVESIETSVQIGRPTSAITTFADENDVDQIVMGSHGRSGISRILMGSVAETVVRRADVPVTIVR